MLIVTRLKLSNICQYENIDIPIETGLMAVCGKNGSGKSTLLRGLMYGLTGLVDGSWGTQQNLQKDGSVTPGYVVVTVKDDQTNKEYIIKRYAASGPKFADTVTEFADGQYKEVATRRKTVDAYMGELYGISCALLFQLCWGRQGQLDMLLTAPAAYVSTFLSAVWSTKHLEKLREYLKNATDSVAAMADPTAEIAAQEERERKLLPMLDDLTTKLKDAKAERDRLQQRRQQLNQQISNASVEDAKKAAVLSDRLVGINTNIGKVLQALANADLDAVKDKTIEELQEALDSAQKAFTELSTAAEEDRLAVVALGNSVQRISDDKTEIEAKIHDVNVEHQRVHAILTGNGADTCAFCGGAVHDMDRYVNNTMRVLGYADDRGFLAFNDKLTLLHDEECALDRRLKDVQEGIKQKTASWKDLSNKAAMKGKDISDLTEKLRIATLLAQYNELDTTKATLEKQLQECQTNAADSEITKELEDIVSGLIPIETTIQDLEEGITTIKGHLAAAEQIKQHLAEEKEQYEVNASARNVLVLLRDVFSQQRAQARYFASKAVELNQHLEAFLELTGMPFNLRLDSDTRLFSYTSEGGFEHPTAHLSGAQKNISAVALQMALVEVIKPNINLFLFDEPSEALDVENKIVMSDLFRRMNRLLPSIGGTMLIVSRDEQLIESCENIIDVTANKETDNAR